MAKKTLNKDYTKLSLLQLQKALGKGGYKRGERRDDLIARLVARENKLSEKTETPKLNKIVSFFGIVFVALIVTILIKLL